MHEEKKGIRSDFQVVYRAWGNAFYLSWWIPWMRLRLMRRDLYIWDLRRKITRIKKETEKMGLPQ